MLPEPYDGVAIELPLRTNPHTADCEQSHTTDAVQRVTAKTDAATALKHIGLDLTGTGIGGFAGAKAGALVGAIFGPIGSAIGGIAGGIGGAIAGRSNTDKVKRRQLDAAIGRCNAAITALGIDAG